MILLLGLEDMTRGILYGFGVDSVWSAPLSAVALLGLNEGLKGRPAGLKTFLPGLYRRYHGDGDQ